jgi:hypothetical protein
MLFIHFPQIARLYQPLDAGSMSDLEDDDDDDAVQLLPTHTHHSSAGAPKGGQKPTRLADVWDAREELFGIGGDSDDEDAPTPRAAGPPPPPSQPHTPNGQPVPKIFVTAS